MMERCLRILAMVIASSWGVIGVLSLAPCAMSVMIFDSPQVMTSGVAIAGFICLILFPVSCVIAAGVGLWLAIEGSPSAFLVEMLPLVNIAVFAALVVWGGS
jgi:hypothetical protein